MGSFSSKSSNNTGSVKVLSYVKASDDSGNMAASSDSSADTVEVVACNVNEIADGEMKEVDIANEKALLVRDKDCFYAVGHKCSHYGAPLSKGVYYNGRVRCQWHGACFSVKTGDIEDFPGLDSLPKFDVEVSSGQVKIKADRKQLSSTKRIKSMVTADPKIKQTFLLVGGGPASVACAETLRQEGFRGQIIIATKENILPYDRPKLSKAMDVEANTIALRNADFYEKYNIQIKQGKEAVSVNIANRKVVFKDKSNLKYDALLIATGGSPRIPMSIKGFDLQNVCQLRTVADANFIKKSAEGKNVVIIGSSFIGMEVAAALSESAETITIVGRTNFPLENSFGRDVAEVIMKLHEEKGVIFHMGQTLSELRGESGKLSKVILSNGIELPADLCVLGIGVIPETNFLKDSGIEMNKQGFIKVDKLMKTNKPAVFAAGDITEFPLFSADDASVNIQHWQMAHAQGRNAGLNMLNKKVELKSVPYFWTMSYGKSIRYTGYSIGYDDVVIHGELDALKFVAFYTKGDDVVAVSSSNFDPIVSQAAEVILAGMTIKKSEVRDNPTSWVSRLKK